MSGQWVMLPTEDEYKDICFRMAYYKYPESIERKQPSYVVWAKWDGCLEFQRYFNGEELDNENPNNIEQIHICNIDETIELLKEIKAKGVEIFKGTSGEEYWEEKSN